MDISFLQRGDRESVVSNVRPTAKEMHLAFRLYCILSMVLEYHSCLSNLVVSSYSNHISVKQENQHQNLRKLNPNVEDSVIVGRVRRAISRSAVEKILQSAKLISPNGRTRIFQKQGGLEEALRDFQSFKPTHVDNFGNVQVGISGKKAVILNSETGHTNLEVRYYRQDEFGGGIRIRTDIIKYMD